MEIRDMWFSPSVRPIEFPAAMLRTINFVGWREWEKRVLSLAKFAEAIPFMNDYLHEKHGCEIGFLDHWLRYHFTGMPIYSDLTQEQYRFVAFASMFSKLHFRLNDKGRKRLVGMARHGLKSENGLEELAFEFLILGNLMTQGFDVTCNDYEKLHLGGTYDFLAKKLGIELEVECKHVSADIGRQIHRRRLYQLGQTLLPIMTQHLESSKGTFLIHLKIPGRLNCSDEQISNLSALLRDVVAGEGVSTDQHGNSIRKEYFVDFEGEIEVGKRSEDVSDYLRALLSERYSITNKNTIVLMRPEQGGILLVIESQKSDKVLDGMYRQLKDSAKDQFSGGRPVAQFVFLSDLSHDQLLSLAKEQENKPTGLQVMANNLIERRRVLHTIVFISRGLLGSRQVGNADLSATAISESMLSYSFVNDQHPLVSDERLASLR